MVLRVLLTIGLILMGRTVVFGQDASDAGATPQVRDEAAVNPSPGASLPEETFSEPSSSAQSAETKPIESAEQGVRGMTFHGQTSPVEYRTRRAVIIGINYAGRPDQGDGVVPLRNAENDAKEVAEVLKAHFGFQPDDLTLLVGEAATERAIWHEIAKAEEAAEDDCVLFYFSGHGVLLKSGRQNTQGALLPYDVTCVNRQPEEHTTIGMEQLVKQLSKSKARHKLLVLDSCASGALFGRDWRNDGSDQGAHDPSAFKASGFQAIVASHALQNAADSARAEGGEGHSPFTSALLKALRDRANLVGDQKSFKATYLFQGMKIYLDASLSSNQAPSCGWINDSLGEFHFTVRGKLPEPGVPSEEIRKCMIAMVPGTFGNWWFDESPWFHPGLRFEILKETETTRSAGQEMISVDEIEQAASKALNRMREAREHSPSNDKVRRRLEHMEKLRATSDEQWKSKAGEIVASLNALAEAADSVAQQPSSALEAVDFHFLAVLQHALRKDPVAADKAYARAIEKYREEAKTTIHMQAMQAMCHADHGWFALDVSRDYDAACRHFAQANSVFGADKTPASFKTFVFCRHAEALQRQGREGAAEEQLELAKASIQSVDPRGEMPISAAFYHRRAWLRMSSCKFTKAVKDFDSSSEILQALNDRAGLGGIVNREKEILYFHNLHGKAMATRFLGERDVALSQYRSLYGKIVDLFQNIRTSESRESNYRQTKNRLVERLVNTQERIGDCNLFSYPIDPSEAADDYRRALRTCSYLPAELRPRFQTRLRYKYALSLLIPGSAAFDPPIAEEQLRLAKQELALATAAQTSAAGNPTAPSKDFLSTKEEGNVVEQPKSAEALAKQTNTQAVAANREHLNRIGEKDVAICARLAELLMAVANHPVGTAPSDCEKQIADQAAELRAILDRYLDEERLDRSLTRDEIEAALFCLRTMIEELDQPLAELQEQRLREFQLTRRNDIERLLGYCRSARRGRQESLQFARPYFDCAVHSLVALKPTNSKQLLEIACESMTGETHRKPSEKVISLVVYSASPASYVFLDIPGSTSSVYPLDPSINVEAIQAAARSKDRLSLPREVFKELSVAAIDGTPVVGLWRDEVRRIGSDGQQAVTAMRVGLDRSETEDALDARSSEGEAGARIVDQFPFRLPEGVVVFRSTDAQPSTPVRETVLTGNR
ncbi:caspase domain-containing protein [Planctomyces sp. SH-PL14]|uniref:caspase family protein n=1 Tax=Planctomyces sp. SH-PL14 TaxID=1632864 RepID=UPI00078C6530|nr:caspase family protein [Planctomyces sp. SH-PL14]AMV20205.1 Caspase domain protein [Planctomyces sp. SH-PL14]